MQGHDAVGRRAGLAVATFLVGISGVVAATEGTTFPFGAPPSVTLTQAAAVRCLATGPYAAPAQGSTGVPAGLALCPSGPLTVTEPGTVVDGWDVRGGIVVDAPDVIVRRSRITGDGSMPYGIRTTDTGSVRIEDTTLTGDFPEAAIGDERWTGVRLEITRVTHDGARLGNRARLRNSAVRDFAPAAGVAPNALVLLGSGRDVLVEDNRIGTGSGAGSAVRLSPTGEPRCCAATSSAAGTTRSTRTRRPPARLPSCGSRATASAAMRCAARCGSRPGRCSRTTASSTAARCRSTDGRADTPDTRNTRHAGPADPDRAD
jgi:hypothetical protein